MAATFRIACGGVIFAFPHEDLSVCCGTSDMDKQDLVWVSAAALIGYLLGSVNFAVIVAKRHGVDILKAGSGNPGATNVKRVIGKKAGNLVFFLDALKGFVAAGWPLLLCFIIESRTNDKGTLQPIVLMQLAGFFGALIGHCFSVFLKFKGGKGVAVTIGALLGAMPVNMACGGLVWALVFFTSRYVSLASIAMAVALPVIAYLLPGQGVGPHFWFSLFVAVFIVYTHRTNIGRLMRGEENRFSKKPKV